MEKHLLVTISEQKSAFFGIQFVSHFFENTKDLKLTLYYTAPKPLTVWGEERTHETLSEINRISTDYEKRGRRALEKAKIELVKAGFDSKNIFIKFQTRRFSKTRDIIDEGEKGLYDAVVLGRRGLTWLEEVFDESTSREFLANMATFPVWLCRGPVPENKDILLCLDGSGASQRITDHVGFMIGNEKKHGITILVINANGKIDKENADIIFARAKKQIINNGVSADIISTKFLNSDKIADNIIKIAKEGRFATVAVGHETREQGFFRKLFSGSVCSKLFRELETAALWIQH